MGDKDVMTVGRPSAAHFCYKNRTGSGASPGKVKPPLPPASGAGKVCHKIPRPLICCVATTRKDGFMKSILEELYMGNIRFDAGYYGQNSPFVKAAERKLDSMEKLAASLNEAEKKLFEQYCDAQGDIEDITRYDTFTSALKFGILLMIEIFMGAYEAEGGGQAE